MAGVLFLHGLGKNSSQWNVTEFDKTIDIEKSVATTKIKTVLYDLPDFSRDPRAIIEEIADYIDSIGESKRLWTIVAHSLGAMYALGLIGFIKVSGLVLIDPTVFDVGYIDDLRKRDWPLVVDYLSSSDFEPFPKTRYHVHLNYDDAEKFERKMRYYSKFTTKNHRSKIIVHPDSSHMIHYTDAPKIIDSIQIIIRS